MVDLRRKDLAYPDLSYKIVGILFDVHNELGEGYQEKRIRKENDLKMKRQEKKKHRRRKRTGGVRKERVERKGGEVIKK